MGAGGGLASPPFRARVQAGDGRDADAMGGGTPHGGRAPVSERNEQDGRGDRGGGGVSGPVLFFARVSQTLRPSAVALSQAGFRTQAVGVRCPAFARTFSTIVASRR